MKEADLLAGVKALWDANATLTELVPGGLHEGRVGEGELPAGQTERAYATMRVVLLDPIEWNSGPWSLQVYRLDLMVWVPPAAGITAAAKPIGRAIDLMLERSRRDELLVEGAETVDLVRVAGTLTEDATVKEASDVYVWGGAWEVKLYVPRLQKAGT